MSLKNFARKLKTLMDETRRTLDVLKKKRNRYHVFFVVIDQVLLTVFYSIFCSRCWKQAKFFTIVYLACPILQESKLFVACIELNSSKNKMSVCFHLKNVDSSFFHTFTVFLVLIKPFNIFQLWLQFFLYGKGQYFPLFSTFAYVIRR